MFKWISGALTRAGAKKVRAGGRGPLVDRFAAKGRQALKDRRREARKGTGRR
jgi:hypothetical protein